MIRPSVTTENLRPQASNAEPMTGRANRVNSGGKLTLTSHDRADWKDALRKSGQHPTEPALSDLINDGSPVEQELYVLPEMEMNFKLEVPQGANAEAEAAASALESDIDKSATIDESATGPEDEQGSEPVVNTAPVLGQTPSQQKLSGSESGLETEVEFMLPVESPPVLDISLNEALPQTNHILAPPLEPFSLEGLELRRSAPGVSPQSLVTGGAGLAPSSSFNPMTGRVADLPEVAIQFQSDALKGTEMQLRQQGGVWQLVALCSSGAAAESLKNQGPVLVQRFSQKQLGKLDIDVLLRTTGKRIGPSGDTDENHKETL